MIDIELKKPGRLSDWSGNHLSRKCLYKLNLGNIVRIHVGNRTNDPNYEYECAPYVRIWKICKDGKFKGIIEDPYMTPGIEYSYQNGESITFSRAHIVEIPTKWRGNKNLRRLVPQKTTVNSIY